MLRWTGIALALEEPGGDEMASRLPTYLHPVAGRPLVWHALAALASNSTPPERLILLTRPDLSPDLFSDLAVEPEVVRVDDDGIGGALATLNMDGPIILSDGAAPLLSTVPRTMLQGPPDSWLDDGETSASAACIDIDRLREVATHADPLSALRGILPADGRISHPLECRVVRRRADLASVGAALRDALVAKLMAGGATFLLPETVLVDVDVRVGRDSIIYPGVVLEGQTNIGDETVIGPGCRIIDSWVGSGVELKGWNFIAHTSIRNRAILEPYVRRGYD